MKYKSRVCLIAYANSYIVQKNWRTHRSITFPTLKRRLSAAPIKYLRTFNDSNFEQLSASPPSVCGFHVTVSEDLACAPVLHACPLGPAGGEFAKKAVRAFRVPRLLHNDSLNLTRSCSPSYVRGLAFFCVFTLAVRGGGQSGCKQSE